MTHPRRVREIRDMMVAASDSFDVVVVGGGVVGVATAMALSDQGRLRVLVLEAEKELAFHQTGHNSGVIHSGIYYRPGSLKAANCVAGRELLYSFLAERGIRHERCGKLIVATDAREAARLDSLIERGTANGIKGLRRVCRAEMTEFEPAVGGIAGVLVPDTGIVDYSEVTRAYAAAVVQSGGDIRLGTRLESVLSGKEGEVVLATTRGEVRARMAVNCAGLQCDRVARLFGVRTDVRIVPFKGEYYDVVPERWNLVRNLIYPVPNPDFPFLGVHFTRSIEGRVHAGPNAVPALMRDGYDRFSFSGRDVADMVLFPGFIKMGMRHMGMGVGEIWRSAVKPAFVKDLRRLLPAIEPADLVPGVPGIRAQAMDRGGALLDDFAIVDAPGSIHVLNAPSPAATASISIGRTIANRAFPRLGVGIRKDWEIVV